MCGIVGFVSKDCEKKEIIKKMNDRIIHRGPDGEGYYIDDDVALGHRRLAIIDINGGAQPMISDRYVVVYNGEIYNYKELKEELKGQNYEFQTDCDTEVLLNGYAEWGKELPKKLRGMFAFAIWDKEEKTLFCARDYFGMKPFYYYQNEEVFMFGSEIKSFLEHPKFQKELNKDLLGAFLAFSFTPTDETFFKNVYALKPGHILTVKNHTIEVEEFYDVRFRKNDDDFEKQVDNVSEVMEDSVKHHLVSDVEVGAFLSSGIDSSYIVSLARPQKTYTIGYNDEKYSEIKYAEDLTNRLEIKNYSEIFTKEEYMKIVPKALYHMDEPLYDPAAISLFYLSKMASRDVKVVLGGEGADEFFGGYNTYNIAEVWPAYHKIPYAIRYLISLPFRILPEFRGRNFIVRSGRKLENYYIGVDTVFSKREVKKVLNFRADLDLKKITKPVFDKYKNEDDINKMQAIDIRFWLAKDILLKSDKMSMANSLEVRCPFIDKEVFRVASSLPGKYKVSSKETKISLRAAAGKCIPNESFKKKKLGFPVPMREWIREDDFYQEIKDMLSKDYVREFFDQKYILKLLDQHKSRKKDNYRKVWIIYSFLKWYEIFFLNMA